MELLAALLAPWSPDASLRGLLIASLARVGGAADAEGRLLKSIRVGLDLPFTHLNLIHVGRHIEHGWHVGLLFSGPRRALIHLYGDRVGWGARFRPFRDLL